jgi:hypothetical protein
VSRNKTSSLRNGVQFFELHLPGYGGPETWEVETIFENRLLHEASFFSERDVGAHIEKGRAKWGKLSKARLKALSAKKPLASDICRHCGGDTLAGVVSVYDGFFCLPCKKLGHLATFMQARAASDEKRRKDLDERTALKIERTTMHYRNGREAKNGDKIVQLAMDGSAVAAVGVLYDAKPGFDFCNGYIAPIQSPMQTACLCDCLHVDDVAAMLKEKGLDKRSSG